MLTKYSIAENKNYSYLNENLTQAPLYDMYVCSHELVGLPTKYCCFM